MATDSTDDAELAGWMLKKGDFVALPACAPAAQVGTPVPLNYAMHRRLFVFSVENTQAVLDGSMLNDDGELVVSSPKNIQLGFEWKRTQAGTDNTVVPVGGLGGRLYLSSIYEDEPTDCYVRMKSVLQSVCRLVRGSYPYKCDLKKSVYIGKSLGRRIEQGDVQLRYQNGDVIGIKPNHQCKRR